MSDIEIREVAGKAEMVGSEQADGRRRRKGWTYDRFARPTRLLRQLFQERKQQLS